MKTPDIEALAHEAMEAFWAIVTAHFPNVETGDLSPLTTIQLRLAIENAFAEWINANVGNPD